MGKWWHDPQIKKEDWQMSGTRLTKYILDNREKAVGQIKKHRESAIMKRAMDVIRRVMMQINQCNRDTDTEEQILGYQRYLAIQALEINKPVGDLKLLKEIMGTIERTYMESEEYLLLKAEILLDANEWNQVTLIYNILDKKRNQLPKELNERIQEI
jgi:hypothetical protein